MRRSPLLALALAVLFLPACSDPPPPSTSPKPIAPAPSAVVGTDPTSGRPVVDPGKGPAINASDEVGRRLMAKYPEMKLLGVEQVPNLPLFEVRTTQWSDRTVGYTDKDVSYVYVNGDLYIGEPGGIINYSKQSANARVYKLIEQLPFQQALTFTYGAGARTLVVFEDPDCPRCQEFEADLKAAGAALNMTVKIMPMPLSQLHPQADAKSRHLLCTANPEAAWGEWMTSASARKDWAAFSRKYPADPACPRAGMVDRVMAVAEQLGFNQTPILLFDNGMTFNGRPTLEELERSFTFVEQAKAQGQGVQPPSASAPASGMPAATPAR